MDELRGARNGMPAHSGRASSIAERIESASPVFIFSVLFTTRQTADPTGAPIFPIRGGEFLIDRPLAR
jgi:hypothetical protein